MVERTTSVITVRDSERVYRLPVERINPSARAPKVGTMIGWKQVSVEIGEPGQTWRYPAHGWDSGLRRDRLSVRGTYRAANADLTNGYIAIPPPRVGEVEIPNGTGTVAAVDFAGSVFVLAGRYVHRIDPVTLSVTLDRDLGASVTGQALVVYKNMLYVLCGSSGYIQQRDTSGTWTVSSDVNADYGAVIADRLYIVYNSIIRSCSALPLSASSYITHATVGDAGIPVTGMSGYGGTVWVMKENGAFVADSLLRFYNQVPQMEAWPNALNGRNAFNAKGSLFIPTVNGLIEVQRGVARYVGPELFQRGSYGLLAYCGREWAGDIYLAGRDGSGDGACVLVMRESEVNSRSYWVMHSWAMTGVDDTPAFMHITTLGGYPMMFIGYAGSTSISTIRLGESGLRSFDDPDYEYGESWWLETGAFRPVDDTTTKSIFTGVSLTVQASAACWFEVDIKVDDSEWLPCIGEDGAERQYGNGAMRVIRYTPRYILPGSMASIRVRGGLPANTKGSAHPTLYEVWCAGIAMPRATRMYEVAFVAGDRVVAGGTMNGLGMKDYQVLLSGWRNTHTVLDVEIPWLFEGERKMLVVDVQYQDVADIGGAGADYNPGMRRGTLMCMLVEVMPAEGEVSEQGVVLGATATGGGGGGGNVPDGDKGDITVSVYGTVWTINPDAVTFAKMQDIGTDRLIGRDSPGTGDPEEITVGGGLEFTGTGGIQRSALSGDVTAPAGSNTTTVASNAVTFAKMQDIGTDRLIGRDSPGTGDPEELTVGGGLEFTGSGGIRRSALTGDVTAAAGSNTTTIANDAVTFAKMQNVTTDRLIGRDSPGTGDPEELTVGGGLEFTGSGGIQRSALTGDVTAPAGSNTTTIANDAVTFAKMQDLNAARVVGRTDASAGDPQELSVASPLQISGTQLQFNQSASLNNNARVTVRKNSGSNTGTRRRLNFIEGANVTITTSDDATDEEIDITIAASPGGVTDGDKGDITVSGNGSTWTIDPDVVTFAKMQNIGTDRLIGRDTPGTGDPEEITVGGGLEFTGSGGIQRSALTGDVTAPAGSNTTTIANDAVTFAKMQNLNAGRLVGRTDASSGDPQEISAAAPLQISGTQLQFNQSANLNNNARVTVRKNSGSNTGTRRRLNFIEGSNITITTADDATDEEIDITISATGGGGSGVSDGDKGDITVSNGGTVWTIDPDVVTFAKMQDINAGRLIGRDGPGTGDPGEITVGGGLEFTGTGGIQRSALTGDVTAPAGSNTTTIANGAVTFAKMQNISAGRLLGRTNASSGAPQEIGLFAPLAINGAGLQLRSNLTTATQRIIKRYNTNVFLADIDGHGMLIDAPFVPSASSTWRSLVMTFGALTTVTMVVDRCYFIPFHVQNHRVVQVIGIEVTTAASGATGEVAIYSADSPRDYRPFDRLVYVSGLDLSTTGIKSGTVSETLHPGLYWAAVRVSAAISVRGSANVYAFSVNGSNRGTHLYYSDTALNNPTPDPTTIGLNTVPLVLAIWTGGS